MQDNRLMKITILYGNPLRNGLDFTSYIEKLAAELRLKCEVDYYFLDEMNLDFCTGCWSCWWKTPGECVLQDDARQIFRSVINSDFVIFASPMIGGFISSSLKKITDRLIVLLHPYIKIIHGESHHKKRYDRYPDFGVIVKKEKDTDEEDIQILRAIYDRFALNFHSKQQYLTVID
jgi:multimeric flavodoxin WrbA